MGCTTQSRESKGKDNITIIIDQAKYIDIFNGMNKNISFIHPLGHGMNKTTLQNKVSTP